MPFDLIIVGSGLTGMRAAISAAQAGIRCAVLSMVYPVRSPSVAAQGGINAALSNVEGEEDSWEQHAFDTVKGSDFLADQNAVAILTKEAVPRVLVARSIMTEIREGRGFEDAYVHLDLTHLGSKRIMIWNSSEPLE